MKIAIASDHGGFALKQQIMEYLTSLGYEYKDFGCYDTSPVDYNDYALPVAESVAAGEYDFGILLCGTGIGMSIVANKVKGIRCAHCQDVFSAKATRQHNDANVIALGERVIGAGLMKEIVGTFLKTPFSNEERHIRRVEEIMEVEQNG